MGGVNIYHLSSSCNPRCGVWCCTEVGVRRGRLRCCRSSSCIERQFSVAELPDECGGLQENSPGHLRLTGCAVREDDGHFHDPKAGTVAEVVHLHLKAVAVGLDAIEVEGLEHLPAEALEAAGAVPDRQVQEGPGVEAATLADEPSQQRPFFRSTSCYVARSYRQVRGPGHLQEAWQILRTVREVCVHL